MPLVAGASTEGSSASVEAPAAPDFACVSVIDQILFVESLGACVR
jgi:hypothetical protein